MDFKWHDRSSSQKRLIPNELIGLWERLGRKYEFRADGRYYVLDLDMYYRLLDSGMTLVHSGTRYKRLYGDPVGLSGVWQLEADPLEEWNLRTDGSYWNTSASRRISKSESAHSSSGPAVAGHRTGTNPIIHRQI